MRVTKELKEKILREVENKYDGKRRAILEKKDEIKTKEIDDIVTVLEVLEQTVPILKILNGTTYQQSKTIRHWIEKNLRNHYFSENLTSYQEVDKKLTELTEDKKYEIEEIMIRLSYEKSLDGIAEIFERFNLRF